MAKPASAFCCVDDIVAGDFSGVVICVIVGAVSGVEGEGKEAGVGDVAGEVGLAHLDGVGPLHQLAGAGEGMW